MSYFIIENAEGKKVYVDYDNASKNWLIESDNPRFLRRFPDGASADSFLLSQGYCYVRSGYKLTDWTKNV